MKKTLLSLALLAGAACAGLSATVPFPDVPTAKEQAKAAGKPALILWYGSDWMSQADTLCKDWETLSRSGLPVVFGQFDERLGLDNNVRTKILPLEEFNLPAAVLLTPDGTFMADFSGPEARDTKKLKAALKMLLPKAGEFAKLAETARTSPGAEGAKAAGRALALLPVEDAMKNKALIEIINQKDPGDATGYRSLFGLEHMGMYKEINAILKGGADGKLKGADRQFDLAEQYVRKALAHNMLKGERLQQWLCGLAYVQRERMLSLGGQRDARALANAYKAIAKIDPKSQYGKGAAKLARYWDPQSFYVIKDNFYNSGDQTLGFEKDWHIDVTPFVNGPGTYGFSLVPMDNGGMVTRNYRLVVNGKEVAKADAAPDKNTKTANFAVPSLPKGAKVEVWLTAQCNDGWLSCQGFIEMKKKN